MRLNKTAYRRLFYATEVFRIFGPLTIFLNPVVGLVSATAGDVLDGLPASRSGMSRSQYHSWDKLLDIYWYAVLVLFFLATPELESYRTLMVGLWFWRLAGLLLFLQTRNRIFFVLAPNFVELAGMAIILGLYVPGLELLLTSTFVHVLLVVHKVALELVMHFFTYPIGNKVFWLNIVWEQE